MKLSKENILKSEKCQLLKKKYSEVRCVGDFVYCVKDYEIIQYKPTELNILANEILIELQGTIDHFITSFAYSFVCCSEFNNEPTYFIFPHNDPKPIQITLPLPINNISTDLILNHGASAFIISDNAVYESNLLENPIKFHPLKMLKGKSISKICAGKGHFFAFEAKQKELYKWTVSDVVSWAEKNGLQDFIKIFKV